MSKFENVLKAQKVRAASPPPRPPPLLFFFVVVSPFVRSFVRKERDRNARGSLFRGPFFISFSPKNDLISSFLLLLLYRSSGFFRQRDNQQFYQQQHKHVHLKGNGDMISSVAIPLAMTAGAVGMLAMGLKDLMFGTNKKPGF